MDDDSCFGLEFLKINESNRQLTRIWLLSLKTIRTRLISIIVYRTRKCDVFNVRGDENNFSDFSYKYESANDYFYKRFLSLTLNQQDLQLTHCSMFVDYIKA